MATEWNGSAQQGGWPASSPASRNPGTGRGAAAASAGTSEVSNPVTEAAQQQEPPTRYLTSSGLFETSPRPAAFEKPLESTATPEPAGSDLVNQFRSVLLQPPTVEKVPPRKSQKGPLALGVAGLLLASIAAGIYLYHPRNSAAQFQMAKTWMAKQWTAELQEISGAFHPQAAGVSAADSDPPRAFSRKRRSANLGLPVAPQTLLLPQPPDESVTPFDLYVTDFYGRHWIFTATGQGFGPVNHFGGFSARQPEPRPSMPTACRSLFYSPGCP